MPDQYWNHNTHYHSWVLDRAREHRGDALDVGCGDGLLVERLALVCDHVTGIDTDPHAVQLATDRTARLPNVDIELAGLGSMRGRQFDFVSMVAVLHHLPLREGLMLARDLVAPGGGLAIVGLTRTAGGLDWLFALVQAPVAHLLGRLRGKTDYDGMAATDPAHTLAELRDVVDEVLPGARIRRALLWRYLLTWRRPPDSGTNPSPDVGSVPRSA
ncbi:bifunctional 2-polyprenyl-6-hydroxyphenol methylase/3-demethylubiquinol 3-O-methyltransferase UbiG [Blastococcus sp. Marseille-P5729]|uniref:class I SAM-dependent methyltransferase n=1 Tax=Blastococcus sp. Marseille-P5729 TaxID=2086582 RepID=UPI000D104007|nr:methyltransferase [Blastococcus sp. Marseille-P5729]